VSAAFRTKGEVRAPPGGDQEHASRYISTIGPLWAHVEIKRDGLDAILSGRGRDVLCVPHHPRRPGVPR
jgi:hypothetical protein